MREGRAALAVGAGVVLLLAAGCAYAAVVYSESGTTCPSLAVQTGNNDAFCDAYYATRRGLVRALLFTGAGAIAVGAAFGFRWHRQRQVTPSGPEDLSVPVPVLLFLAALAVPAVEIAGYLTSGVILPVAGPDGSAFASQVEYGLPDAWLHLLLLIAVVLVCLAARLAGPPHLSARSAGAAAAVGYALALLGRVDWTVLGERGGQHAVMADDMFLLSGIPVGAALGLFTVLQRRAVPAPPLWLSCGLALITSAAATLVFVPAVLPRWREACCSPGAGAAPDPETWVPLLVLPSVLTTAVLLVWYVRARQRLAA